VPSSAADRVLSSAADRVPSSAADLVLARSDAIGHTAPTMTHTCVSWSMCMRWRPRRVEEGA